jgi:hypothetical protein
LKIGDREGQQVFKIITIYICVCGEVRKPLTRDEGYVVKEVTVSSHTEGCVNK